MEAGSNLQDKRTEAELNKEVEYSKRNNDEEKLRSKKVPSSKSGEPGSNASSRVLRSQTSKTSQASQSSARQSSKGSAQTIDEYAPQ